MMRPGFFVAILLAVASQATAELIVLSNGYTLATERHVVEGEEVQLYLADGGEVRLPLNEVAAVLPDEVARTRAVPAEAVDPVAETDDWLALATEAARRHRIEPQLVQAIIDVESAFQPDAVSPKGAMGLMQLMPATAAELGVEDPFDPQQNIDGGVRHLRGLLERYGGDRRLALAAYNAGVAAVERYNGIPPYSETRGYVRKVLTRYRQVRQ